jgi:hypothetical protein
LNVELRSENRFDAGPFCFLRKFDRAMQVAEVGQRDGRHAMLFGETFTIAAGDSVESRNV